MFLEFHDPSKKEHICRNSWGDSFKYIRIPAEADWIDLYYVHVKNFVWRGYDKRPDIKIIDNFKFNDLENWPDEGLSSDFNTNPFSSITKFFKFFG